MPFSSTLPVQEAGGNPLTLLLAMTSAELQNFPLLPRSMSSRLLPSQANSKLPGNQDGERPVVHRLQTSQLLLGNGCSPLPNAIHSLQLAAVPREWNPCETRSKRSQGHGDVSR